jgi:hypothetical protein
METHPPQEQRPTIQDLYPGLSGAELSEAEENLLGYIEESWESYQEIRVDPKRYGLFKALTRPESPSRMKERSNSEKQISSQK